MAIGVALVAAYGSMTATKNLAEGDSIKVGNKSMVLTATVNTTAEVLLGADETASLANIIAAVNGTGTAGVTYWTAAGQPDGIIASLLSTHVIRFTAKMPGAQGNNFDIREVTDGGTAYSVAAFATGSGNLDGTSGWVQSLLDNNQVNSEIQQELKKLTSEAD